MLTNIETTNWDQQFQAEIKDQALNDLEAGQILFLPKLEFALTEEEQYFLNPDFLHPHSKNISFQPQTKKLWGVQRLTDKEHMKLKRLMERFSKHASQLIESLLPTYADQLITCRTSLRPIQVCNRKCSYRKDDKRMHIDAFPSAPNQGHRIIRVFCNVNPRGEDLIWRVGEPFEAVAKQFLPKISAPMPGIANLLRLLRVTKSTRTAYDHYMLQMHNKMKADMDYQTRTPHQDLRFPPGTTWIAQTDMVSYAAMKGQHIMEQTFYLPVEAMQNPALSPLHIMEEILQKKLA